MNSTEKRQRPEDFLQDCLMTTWVLWVDSLLHRDRNGTDSFCEFWCMLFIEERKKILHTSLLGVRWHF